MQILIRTLSAYMKKQTQSDPNQLHGTVDPALVREFNAFAKARKKTIGINIGKTFEAVVREGLAVLKKESKNGK